MTALALLLEACQMVGIREPLDFYDLTPYAQGLWLSHARNKVGGFYAHGAPKGDASGWQAEAIAAARERGVL